MAVDEEEESLVRNENASLQSRLGISELFYLTSGSSSRCEALGSTSSDSFCDCVNKRGQELYEIECTCGENNSAVFEWEWDRNSKSSATVLCCKDREVRFHSGISSGTAAVRGSLPMKTQQYYWEIKMLSPVYGTDMMVGVGTGEINLDRFRNVFYSLLGADCESWGLSYTGNAHHKGQAQYYSSKFGQGSIIGVHLDLWHGTLSFFKNRQPLGIAYHNLRGKTLFPMVSSTAARSGMKVIRSSSFKSSLQYMCCLKLRQSIPEHMTVIDAISLPPGLKTFLKKNLDWLVCTKKVDGSHHEPSTSKSNKRKSGCSDDSETQARVKDGKRRKNLYCLKLYN